MKHSSSPLSNTRVYNLVTSCKFLHMHFRIRPHELYLYLISGMTTLSMFHVLFLACVKKEKVFDNQLVLNGKNTMMRNNT